MIIVITNYLTVFANSP